MKIELYNHLPAIYRNRDAVEGEPLRALMAVLEDELDEMRRDIDRLYDNWFIETCDEWVVPYIGDLLGVSGMHPGRPEVFSLRAFVANTLAYRRRKGTASVLENISQDVSGWSASVVEFFQLITTTQNMNHVRLTTVWSTDESEQNRVGAVGTLDLRKGPLVASLGTAFDTASRTIDIREFTQTEGWHNVDRLGIFIWRLRSFPMREAMPKVHNLPPAGGYAYTFSIHPCEIDAPLFVNPERRIGATQRMREWEVPQRIDHDAFVADMERYYGDEKSLLITVAGTPIAIDCISALDLENWEETIRTPPEGCGGDVWAYVDVTRGRLLIESSAAIDPDSVRVDYHYGFSANIGGGPYGREVTAPGKEDVVIQVAKRTSCGTLSDALTLSLPPGSRRIIRIMDNGIYDEGFLYHTLLEGEELIIEAADGVRPTITGFLYFQTPPVSTDLPTAELCQVTPDGTEPQATIRLSGLLISGFTMFEGKLTISVEDCTILPDLAYGEDPTSIYVASLSYHMEIDIVRCITGPLGINAGIKQLSIRDSIVDANIAYSGVAAKRYALRGDEQDMTQIPAVPGPGPDTLIERSTIIGDVKVHAMSLASDSIFMGNVQVERKHDGCMRYCYVDASFDNFAAEDRGVLSRTPRRFRCQPDLALAGVDALQDPTDASEREKVRVERERARKGVKPLFCSLVYGHPDYARLASVCPEEIRKGAEDSLEMGVFGHIMEPQREANLREGVRRYLPFGLEMNILYADEETK